MKHLVILFFLALPFFSTAQKVQKDSADAYVRANIKANGQGQITGPIMNAALIKLLRGIIDTAYYSGDSLYIAQNGTARFLRRDSWKKTGNYVSNTNASNVGINTTAPDSALSVMGGILGTGGVRLTGLPSAAGTKALRYNPATGNVSYADTSAGGGGGGGTPTIQQALTAGATLTTSNNIINGNNELKISGLNGSYSSRINDQITLSLDSTKTETPLITVMPHKWHPDHTNFFFNVIGSNQFPYQGKNNVATFGWNIGPGGGAVKAGRPGIGYSMESNYHPDSDSGATWVESHEFFLTRAGIQKRLKSYTVNVAGVGSGNLYHTVDVFSLQSLNTVTPFVYFGAGGDSTSATSNIYIGTQKGRSASLSVTPAQVILSSSGGSAELITTAFKQIRFPGNKIYIDSLNGMFMLGTTVVATGYNTMSGFEIIDSKSVNVGSGYFSNNPGAGHLGWRPQGNVDITNDKDSALKVAFVQHNHNFAPITKLFYGGNLVMGLNISSTVQSSAALQINDTARGFLPPRMTSAQATAIASKATGLTMYCTDCTATDGSTGVMITWNGSVFKNNW